MPRLIPIASSFGAVPSGSGLGRLFAGAGEAQRRGDQIRADEAAWGGFADNLAGGLVRGIDRRRSFNDGEAAAENEMRRSVRMRDALAAGDDRRRRANAETFLGNAEKAAPDIFGNPRGKIIREGILSGHMRPADLLDYQAADEDRQAKYVLDLQSRLQRASADQQRINLESERVDIARHAEDRQERALSNRPTPKRSYRDLPSEELGLVIRGLRRARPDLDSDEKALEALAAAEQTGGNVMPRVELGKGGINEETLATIPEPLQTQIRQVYGLTGQAPTPTSVFDRLGRPSNELQIQAAREEAKLDREEAEEELKAAREREQDIRNDILATRAEKAQAKADVDAALARRKAANDKYRQILRGSAPSQTAPAQIPPPRDELDRTIDSLIDSVMGGGQ